MPASARAVSVSPRNASAITNVNSGLETWNALVLAGPSRATDSYMNQRPR